MTTYFKKAIHLQNQMKKRGYIRQCLWKSKTQKDTYLAAAKAVITVSSRPAYSIRISFELAAADMQPAVWSQDTGAYHNLILERLLSNSWLKIMVQKNATSLKSASIDSGNIQVQKT